MNAFDDLVARLKKVPVSRLGDVVAAMDGHKARSANMALDRDLVGVVTVETIAKALLDCTSVDGDRLDALEKAVVELAYARAKRNQSLAARLLGIERKAFARRLVKYGVK